MATAAPTESVISTLRSRRRARLVALPAAMGILLLFLAAAGEAGANAGETSPSTAGAGLTGAGGAPAAETATGPHGPSDATAAAAAQLAPDAPAAAQEGQSRPEGGAPPPPVGSDAGEVPTTGLNLEPVIPPCLTADGHPRIEARVSPAPLLVEGRLYFRSYGTARDYYVPLAAEEEAFAAYLPVPLDSTRQVVFWLRAFDRSGADYRTSEFVLDVRTLPRCPEEAELFPEDGELHHRASRSLVIGLTTDDQPIVPPGFAAQGITHYRTAAGVQKEAPAEVTGGAGGGGWSRLSTGAKTAIIAGSAAAVVGAALLLGRDNPRDEDNDGDGYSESSGDCNDSDDSVYPGAPEICDDNLDNDCDGRTDVEDLLDCADWIDNDNDGYREVDGDCDDFDRDVNPGAQEICDDNVDNDCDGLTDGEDTEDCQGSEDFDGDGYPASVDCDDHNRKVNPGAREDCVDGIDNDCDELTDGADPDCAPALVWFVLTQPPFDTDWDEILSLTVDGVFFGRSPYPGGSMSVARVLARGTHSVRVDLEDDPDEDGSGFLLQLNSPDPSVESLEPAEFTGTIYLSIPFLGEFVLN